MERLTINKCEIVLNINCKMGLQMVTDPFCSYIVGYNFILRPQLTWALRIANAKRKEVFRNCYSCCCCCSMFVGKMPICNVLISVLATTYTQLYICIYIYIHMHVYIYMYIYMYVCM